MFVIKNVVMHLQIFLLHIHSVKTLGPKTMTFLAGCFVRSQRLITLLYTSATLTY